jgi:hypothetical protein
LGGDQSWEALGRHFYYFVNVTFKYGSNMNAKTEIWHSLDFGLGENQRNK